MADYLIVDKEKLTTAIQEAKKELDIFTKKLIKINESENLNIPNIEKLLVYRGL